MGIRVLGPDALRRQADCVTDQAEEIVIRHLHITLAFVTLMAVAACGGGGTDSTGTVTPPPRGVILASQVIDSSGGIVGVTDPSSPMAGTQVVIPPGALSTPTTITIGQVSGATGLPAEVLVAELGPAGTSFAVPVTVTMRYAQEYLAANGIADPTTLKVVALGSTAANDTLRTLAQDTVQSTVTAQTSRSSMFAVMGYSQASLSGDYAMNFTMIDARFGPPVQIPINVPSAPYSGLLNVPFPGYGFRDEQGTVHFDGAGNYSWTAVRNVAGARTDVGGSGTYTVSPDGNMRLDFGVEGSVLAGGSTFVLAATTGVPVIEMGVGVKKGGSFNNGSLNGSYAVALYYSDAAAAPAAINLSIDMTPFSGTLIVPFPGYALNSELRTMIFDGGGNYTWTGLRNTSGVSSAVSGSGTYAVGPDGALTFDTGLTGHLLAGSGTFILTTPSGLVQMGAGIRKGGAFSTASLGGRYTVAYQYSDPNAAAPDSINISIPATPYASSVDVPFPMYAFNSEVRTIVFDGAGGYTWTGKRNKGGTTSAGSGSGTYSIDADGVLVMDSRLAGHVLEGGSTFILAPTSGQVTQIGVGILK